MQVVLARSALLGTHCIGTGIQTRPSECGRPECQSDVRKLLGQMGYYRRCIPDFERVAKQLLDLLKEVTKMLKRLDLREAASLRVSCHLIHPAIGLNNISKR